MFNVMKIKTLAEELGIPESTINTWRRKNEIPSSCFKKVGGTVLVRVDRFKEWLENDA